VNQLRNAVEAASDEEGWAPLAAVGSIVTKQAPDFDSRNYGYAKLSDLIDATGKSSVVYARDKRYQPAKKPA
jgi:OST-HTH/LOTUS domain